MARVKVVNDPSDLVGVLCAVDTPLKREVFMALCTGWQSESAIESRYGPAGRSALSLLLKQSMLESRWEPSPKGPHKFYRAIYGSFKIDTTAPVGELSEILGAAMMPLEEYSQKEEMLMSLAGDGGVNLIDASARLAISQNMLRALVKRSSCLEMRGLRVVANGNKQ